MKRLRTVRLFSGKPTVLVPDCQHCTVRGCFLRQAIAGRAAIQRPAILLVYGHCEWLALLAHEENHKFRGLRLAQIPKEPVRVPGRLIEEITGTVGFGWVRIDLTLDLPL